MSHSVCDLKCELWVERPEVWRWEQLLYVMFSLLESKFLTDILILLKRLDVTTKVKSTVPEA